MRSVEDEVVGVRHLAIEGHSLLMGRHLFHTTHELVLGEEDRQRVGSGCFASDIVFELVVLRNKRLESFAEAIFLLVGIGILGSIFFADDVLYSVGVDANEAEFVILGFLLKLGHGVHVEFAVLEKDIVAFGLCALYIGVVGVRVLCVKDNEVAVLIGLCVLDLGLVLIECEVLAVKVLEESKTDGALVEFLVGKHTELDEHLDVVPFLLEVLAVSFEEFCQFVSHFLGDVAADFLDVVVRLQVGTADVQRDIGAVDDAVEEREVFGNDVLDFVGDVYLVAIELNLIAMDVKVVLNLREIEYSGQVERIIDVEVDMEEGLLKLRWIEFVVELIVVLVGEVSGFACPGGINVVDDIVLVEFDLLAVLPVFLLAKCYLNGQELTILAQQVLDGSVLEILRELVVDMEDNVSSAVGFDGIFHLVFRCAFARPVNSFGIVLVAE